MTSFIERLAAARRQAAEERAAAEQAEQAKQVEPPDPWIEVLRGVKGRIDEHDQVERVSTVFLMELLEVPLHRRLGVSKRLCRAMLELGFQPTRVFGLNERGYKEHIRGYARAVETNKNARHLSATVPIDEQQLGAAGG